MLSRYSFPIFTAVFFTLSTFQWSFSQVHDRYPYDQPFYQNGQVGLIKDMIRIVKEKKIPKCNNKNEAYFPAVLVYPDSKINLVKDFDSVNIASNGCAFNYTKAILPHMNGWIPAVDKNRVSVKAIASFAVAPFFISNSKLNIEENVFTPPTFSDGHEALQKKISLILTKDLLRNTDQRLIVILAVNDQGKLTDAFVNYSGADAAEIHSASGKLKNLNGDWAPATFNSVTFDWFLLIPMNPTRKTFRSGGRTTFHWDNYKLFRNIQ